MENKTKTAVSEKVEAQAAPQATAPQLDTQPPKAVKAEQTESQTVAPETAQLSTKTAKNFTAYLLPEVVYSEDAALDVLRQKFRSYKEIHPDFLAMTENKKSFELKKEYIPVYRQNAVVDYAWTVKNKGEKTAHSERREVSCRQHNAPAFFKADSFPSDIKTIALASPKQAEELFPCKHKTFSACVEALKKEAKAYAPQKSAKAQLYNRAYEIFYVPVLKAVCKFEDKEYVAYVNLLNGECDAQYRVSDKLLEKADKTLAKVKTCRRFILSTIVYALSFVLLGWYSSYKMDVLADMTVLLIGVSCALLLPIVCYLACFSYSRAKLILKAVRTGKLPKATLATLLALVCLLLAVAQMLTFAFYLM